MEKNIFGLKIPINVLKTGHVKLIYRVLLHDMCFLNSHMNFPGNILQLSMPYYVCFVQFTRIEILSITDIVPSMGGVHGRRISQNGNQHPVRFPLQLWFGTGRVQVKPHKQRTFTPCKHLSSLQHMLCSPNTIFVFKAHRTLNEPIRFGHCCVFKFIGYLNIQLTSSVMINSRTSTFIVQKWMPTIHS